MKPLHFLPFIYLFSIITCGLSSCQDATSTGGAENDATRVTGDAATPPEQEIRAIIVQYARAREEKDTALLTKILTPDIDQLVSSGEWRYGLEGATKGMLQSSERNPGTRTLAVENIRLLNPGVGIADARYEIHHSDGTVRKMWSTFIVIRSNGEWKITAIRNMLPAGGFN